MKTTRPAGWLILIVCCLGLVAFRQSAWLAVSLDNRVSVQLPAQPELSAPTKPEKFIRLKAAGGEFIMFVSPFGPEFQDSQRQQFYDQLVQMLMTYQKDFLQAPAPFTVGKYDGIGFAGYVMPTDGRGKTYTAQRSLIVDKTYYMFQFSCPADSSVGPATGKQFLESILVKASAE